MFLFFHTCPCFATLRHSFLGITPHPLASCLAPNPNGRCSPLSFGSLVFPCFSNMLASSCLHVPSFFKALLFLHFMPFFSNLFLRFPTVFQEFPSSNFLIFPTVSSIFLGFSKFAIHFFLLPPFPPVFNDVPSFSLVFSYLFPSVFRGPRENRTAPSPNCLAAHAPLKNSNWPPLSPPDIEISVHLGNLPPPHTPS